MSCGASQREAADGRHLYGMAVRLRLRWENLVVRPHASADVCGGRPLRVRRVEQGQEAAFRVNFIRASKALFALLAMTVDVTGIGLAKEKQPSIAARGAIASMIRGHGGYGGWGGTESPGTKTGRHEGRSPAGSSGGGRTST
jgi:hypothetical protein